MGGELTLSLKCHNDELLELLLRGFVKSQILSPTSIGG